MMPSTTLVETLRNAFFPYLDGVRLRVNQGCEGMEPWKVVTYSVGGTLVSVCVYNFIFQPGPRDSFVERSKKSFWCVVRKIPAVRNKIKQELDQTSRSLRNSMKDGMKGQAYVTHIPGKGMTEPELDQLMAKYKSLAVRWDNGNCSGMVYSGEEQLSRIITKAYGEFLWTNPLHAEVFPDIRKMEAEIVRMTCNLFNGGPESCGCVSTGGTESIMLAIKAYRDYARARGIKYPEIVVPVTAHAAFDKGAQYFDLKIRHVAVDPKTWKLDVAAMKRAITKNTCMLVGSYPGFPHGVIDPIEDIAKLGLRYNIPVHVDCCLGGFLVCFMKHVGFSIPPFDFSVDGVTSISADTHKYAYAPKGSSIIMYSEPKYRSFQYFACTDWPGGVYASPSFAGSRAGAVLAATWAAMMYTGLDGYLEATRNIITTTRKIAAGIDKIPNLEVMGEPLVSVVAFQSHDFDIFCLLDAMSARGWHLSPLQYPSAIHICCTKLHTRPGVVERLLNNLSECVNQIMENPKQKCSGAAAMYGLAQTIPDRSLVGEMAGIYFDAYYSTESCDDKVCNGVV